SVMSMRCILMAAVNCGLAAHCWASEAGAPIKLEDIQMRYGSDKGLHASVNGTAGVFGFDTGGGLSIITSQFAASIGCHPWGRVTGFQMTGHRLDLPRCDDVHFRIGGVTYTAPTAGVFDIMPRPKDKKLVLAGSIALDIFAGRQITLHAISNLVTVDTPAEFARETARGREVRGRLVRDGEGVCLTVNAGVPTEKGLIWMEMDTGNNGPLVIGSHVASLLGLRADISTPQRAHFELANGVTVDHDAVVQDLIMDGNIGEEVLGHWDVTFDLATGQVWMAPPT
ncbi:MAG TPA: aspartyl protease family protein, partial [Acetobacteraceae bacterium]|nr:aspartyl protease family protein [Acetobacteraceae bacterium]